MGNQRHFLSSLTFSAHSNQLRGHHQPTVANLTDIILVGDDVRDRRDDEGSDKVFWRDEPLVPTLADDYI